MTRETLEKEIKEYDLNVVREKIFLNNDLNKYDDLNTQKIKNIKSNYDDKISILNDKYELEKKEMQKKFIINDIKSTIDNVIDLTPIISYPFYYYFKKNNKEKFDYLLSNGVHFITALQGGGKSSIAYNLAEYIYENEGTQCYLNASFEKARFDETKQKWIKHHQYFKLSEFFNAIPDTYDKKGNVKKYKIVQLKKFNKNFKTIILDEWLTEMNHRQNKTTDYNDVFLALIAMIAHMRHQGIKRIYVLSQIDNTDIQLTSMFKYHHEVQVKLGNSYFNDFLKNHTLENKIVGWHVDTYKVKRNRKKRSTDEILIKKRFVKATADFKYFDTFSMAGKYENLPEDKINLINA